MPFTWGIIGPGRIAQKFAEAVASIDDAVVGSVASRDTDRAGSFATAYGIQRTARSYEALAADESIDAIYIATPHRFHFQQAMMCLEAGKHVLIEKPITVNATECEMLVESAREKNLFVMEALWTRFLPVYSEVRSWLDAGRIGEPMVLSSTFCFPITTDRPERLWRHDLAGGALLDIGVYSIAVSQWAMQRNPIDLIASGHLNGERVDDRITASLLYAPPSEASDRPVSQFTCSFQSQGPNNFAISGVDGTIVIEARFWGATDATLHTDGRPTVRVNMPHRCNGFEYQIEEAMRQIRKGAIEHPTMSHADSLANMKVMDRIRDVIGLRYDFETDRRISDPA